VTERRPDGLGRPRRAFDLLPRTFRRQIGLPSEDGASVQEGRCASFILYVRLQRGAGRCPFQSPRLIVEPLERLHLLVAAEPGFLYSRLQNADRFIIDLDRHRKGMAVLAAMRERKPRRVLETVGRAMHHLGHHRQGLHGARADARRQQQFLEVHRASFGRRRRRAVERGLVVPISLQRMQTRRQRKLEAKRQPGEKRQPGDLGGLGCAPTNRPLVARARCRIDGFRVEGGLDTSAD
jgi:hypothetical protein